MVESEFKKGSPVKISPVKISPVKISFMKCLNVKRDFVFGDAMNVKIGPNRELVGCRALKHSLNRCLSVKSVFALAFTLSMLVIQAFTLGQDAQPQSSEDGPQIRVMSFNLRLGIADDGDDRWELRKELLFKTIENYSPDLLGTQETFPFQSEFLQQQMPDFQAVGRDRNPKSPNDKEQCTILFNRKRFDLVASGHFWLSENPDQAGSQSWDSSLPRMASWVRLWDRNAERALVFVNTHFDHRGPAARANGATVLRQRIENLGADTPIILTGDFNCASDSQPYQNLVKVQVGPSGDTPMPSLIDTFSTIHAGKVKDIGTFNGFKGTKSGARIDWVLVSPQWKIISAEIDDTNDTGRYPSDHFPVTSVIQWDK